MVQCLRKKEIWDPNWFFYHSWWFTWDLLQSAEDMVERLNGIPVVFETHISNAFISLTHRFSQRKIVSPVCVLCLSPFISLHTKCGTQVAVRKNACWVAEVQTAVVWGSRKAWGVTDVPHCRLVDLRALHLATPNISYCITSWELKRGAVSTGHHVLCSLAQIRVAWTALLRVLRRCCTEDYLWADFLMRFLSFFKNTESSIVISVFT